MKIHNVQQGSQEWLELRARYFTASEAPAMMGVSPYMTRSELLKQKHTGIRPDLAAGKEYLFAQGHAAEADYRPIAENIVGEDLYPATGSIQIEGLSLLASFDGLTMDYSIGYEHKLYNADLARMLRDDGEPGPAWYWQLEHQMVVSGAHTVLFVTSNGTDEQEEHRYYQSKPERRAALIAGWKQFAADLAAYTLPEVDNPAPAGRALETLPALHIQVTGAVTASNLDEFKTTAMGVFRGINRQLKTDQDFADAERTVKWCEDVEGRMKAAKEHALSQTASIDALFKAVDDISEMARSTRLELDRLVKARKETIRADIVAAGVAALREHIAKLNETIGQALMPVVPADFAGAIRSKRTLDGLRDAVDGELTRAKIAASEIAGRIQINLRTLQEAEQAFLFPDVRELVLKQPEDLAAIITGRTLQHAVDTKRQEEAAAAAQHIVQAAQAPAVPVTKQAAPQPVAADTGKTIKLGEINARLAPIQITADGLASLGIQSCGSERAAKLYYDADLPRICAALVAHLNTVAQPQTA